MLSSFKRLRHLAALSALAVLIAGCSNGSDSPVTEPFFPAPEDEWTLVFSDEFDGDSLDTATWDVQEGDGAEYGLVRWGNNEEQWYSANNITVADGFLTITAKSEELEPGFDYSSARIRTAEKIDFKYGRIEASVKAAPGQGLWSAFWMLPTDSPYNGWAASGEVDITEVVNADTDAERIFQTLHYGFPWPLNQQSGTDIDDVVDPAGEFHVYAVEWSENEIRWYVDDVNYLVVSSDTWYSYFYADQETGYTAGAGASPFDVNFHVLLNLAVGGNLPGPVDPAAIPSDMVVDYVRIYACAFDEPDGSGCNSNADRNLEGPGPQEPFEDSSDLYVDEAGPLEWSVGGETVTRELAVNSFWDNDGALVFTEVGADDADRGMVIDVVTSNSGNISINAVDGEPTTLLGMGNNPNFWELHAGELKFDLYVDSAGTDPDSSILIKMDSGWPEVGFYELKVADLPADQWSTISVKVNDLIASREEGLEPLDTGDIISFFVLEPTGAAHVQVDNIELACGHPVACGIQPPGGEVDGEIVPVFIDEVAPVWDLGLGAWDTSSGSDYFDGTTGNLITWSILTDADPEHGEIVSVNFGTSGDNGVFFIKSAGGVDLGSFAAEGKLIFDLKLAAGSTHGMVIKVDCFDPCSTGDVPLDLSGDVRGEWNTHEFVVADLISAGLDITNVNAPLVIFPTWDDQQGRSFEVDNIRYENPGGGEPPSGPPTLAGTWQMAPEAGSLGVGPEPGDTSWFACDDACVAERACYFDDDYVFNTDASFQNVLGDETWVEAWQGTDPDACGAPVFPHDGMGTASWTYDGDETGGTLTIDGVGAYVGLPKATNGGEIGSPVEAPPSITYNVTFESNTTILVEIEAGTGDGVWWSYKLVKTAEPPPPPPFVGTWQMAPEAGSLGVGPEPGDTSWFACDDACVAERACYFDDDYVFSGDGTFQNVLGDETWVEAWQGTDPDACGAPVFPHDGMGTASWTYDGDEVGGTLTIDGVGAYVGLPKANNSGELSSPVDAPASIIYNVTFENSSTVLVEVEAGTGDGVWWSYKLIQTE